MKRKALIELLEGYAARWPGESETCERFLEFVRRNEDCFERSLQEGHVTGSAWLVNRAGTHVLLTHHRKLGAWFQLGGHADGESDVSRVALQEALEESGLSELSLLDEAIFDIDIHLIPARKADPDHYHFDVRFVVQATGSEAFQVSEESLDLAWVEIDSISDFTEEVSMLRMAGKWKGRLKLESV
ncbi:NUDIX hydrolase [Pelagicoccus mobilis]|uniref:NUDIX hydrolase n=1 Tax=Pelagicoccus mobilis TaxID=415221 RepID=A0A934S4H1_9BACT|nr:NUDIX hydrolase [Pelagicoccus mobilis]MBK1879612.1 NUDIX hydrolase [Pelagicoccus mobilis]